MATSPPHSPAPARMPPTGTPTRLTPARGPRRGSITQTTPSNAAKRLLSTLVLTPPRTPPPSARGLGRQLGTPGRIRELHVDTDTKEIEPIPPARERVAEESKDATTAAAAAAAAPGSPTGPGTGSGTILHSGWLLKLKLKLQKSGKGSESRWNRRWFVVRDGFLLYFRTETSSFPAGWLRIGQITSVVGIPTDTTIPGTPITPPYCFKVTLASRVLYMQARSKEEVETWSSFLAPAPSSPPRTPTSKKAVAVGKTVLPPLVAARLPSPPRAADSPIRSPLRPSMFRDRDSPAALAAAEISNPDATGADLVPKSATWVKCWDAENSYVYYVHAQTDISAWEIPITDADGGSWVQCFDYENATTFFAHTRTRHELYQDDMPTVDPDTIIDEEPVEGEPYHEEAYAGAMMSDGQGGWTGVGIYDDWAPPERLWVEGWSEEHQVPYYVKFSTGESSWEWPEEEGAQVVQRGDEDSEWYWQWLSGEGAAESTEEAAATGASGAGAGASSATDPMMGKAAAKSPPRADQAGRTGSLESKPELTHQSSSSRNMFGNLFG